MMSRQEAILFTRGYVTPDDGLRDRLLGELPGILALLLRHIVPFTPQLPPSMVELREAMATATEDALEFAEEWLAGGQLIADQEAPAYKCVTVGTLYQHYKFWCDDAGVRPVGRKIFSAVVGRRFPTRRVAGTYRFTGLLSA
jgi:phage/plasmid-associated DNA primase